MIFENQIVEWLKWKQIIIHRKQYILVDIPRISRWRKEKEREDT